MHGNMPIGQYISPGRGRGAFVTVTVEGDEGGGRDTATAGVSRGAVVTAEGLGAAAGARVGAGVEQGRWPKMRDTSCDSPLSRK